MKTLKTYTRLLLLPLLGMLFLALHSCVAPTDISGPNDKKIIDSPYVPAPLIKPKRVEFVLINERTLRPNEDVNRPLWDNEVDNNIKIDTNKTIIFDSLGLPSKRRTLPRIYLEFTATMKQGGAFAVDTKAFMLRKISLAIPDTIDLENDEEIVYFKKELPSPKNYFEYIYKEQQFTKAFVNENSGKLVIKAVKLDQRNRIFIDIIYDVFPATNGTNIPSERMHGSGRLIINY